ncbi:MAG: polysaccharide biosynthesis C-terminal domain-containing protein [Acidimicrobiales bacterium]
MIGGKSTILVTGADGFIGKNLLAELSLDPELDTRVYTRSNTISDLPRLVAGVDFVFHLAGVNRPTDEAEFNLGNLRLTEALIASMETTANNVPVLFSSSTQAALDTPYGRSKAAAEAALFEWAERTNTPVFVYRLPGVFGKWARPNYNSVVATFCHNIARGLPVRVDDPLKELTLIYIDDVVRAFCARSTDRRPGKCRYEPLPQTHTMTLGALLDRVQRFADIPTTLVVPDFASDVDKHLFATFTSYLPPERFGYALDMKRDARGWLTEVIKSQPFGQIFVSRTKPGVSRGNHWHHSKIEKFVVISGSADIKFRNLFTDEVITYGATGEDLHVFDMPAGYVHSITNSGEDDLITLFWADEIFDPQRPDTYSQEV